MSKSVCLIAGGLHDNTMRLQPWRYLAEVARQLKRQGHEVSVISDGVEGDDLATHRIPSVSNPCWQENRPLRHAVEAIQPDVLLWHIGLSSLLHQRLDVGIPIPTVGIFTSPIYQFRDLARLGVGRIVRERGLTAVHTAATLTPNFLLRRGLSQNSHLQRLVVQTETTRTQLQQAKLNLLPISVIMPGVDKVWRNDVRTSSSELRQRLGYTESDVVVLYFGSPARLRGLHTLIEAIQKSSASNPALKLLILSRRHAGELMAEDAALRDLLNKDGMAARTQIISGFLKPENLVAHLAAADVVALPFELVPSDAPLSLLEAQALGKPIVTTTIACLPELVANGPHYLAKPADANSLASAITAAANDLCRNTPMTTLKPRCWQEMGESWSCLIQNL